jgi:hypothetical protein
MTAPVTAVELVFYRDRQEHWLRFGDAVEERIIDRRRRTMMFLPGMVFAFVRWQANEHGTVASRLDILRAVGPGEAAATVPGVVPGADILLRRQGWAAVSRMLEILDAIEQSGIEPADVAPDYWRYLHSRLICRQPFGLYDRARHRAWLARRGRAA